MLLIFSYEIRKSGDDAFMGRELLQQSCPDCVLAVTCMTLCFLSGHELQCFSTAVRLRVEVGGRGWWQLIGKVASAACQCVLACDQLLFQSRLNWGQVILSRATSPSGAAASLSAWAPAPVRLLSTCRPSDCIQRVVRPPPPHQPDDAAVLRLSRADVLPQLSVQGTQEGGAAQGLHRPWLQHRRRRRRRGYLCLLHPRRRPRRPERRAEARRSDLIGESDRNPETLQKRRKIKAG